MEKSAFVNTLQKEKDVLTFGFICGKITLKVSSVEKVIFNIK